MVRLSLWLVIALASSVSASPYVYLDRCTNNCMVNAGADDALAHTTSLAMSGGAFTIGEFANDAGAIGSAADAEWAQIVQCMQEVYSPYAVTLTDQLDQIPAGAPYTDAIIAGHASDLGYAIPIFTIALDDCNDHDNAIAFTFANDLA